MDTSKQEMIENTAKHLSSSSSKDGSNSVPAPPTRLPADSSTTRVAPKGPKEQPKRDSRTQDSRPEPPSKPEAREHTTRSSSLQPELISDGDLRSKIQHSTSADGHRGGKSTSAPVGMTREGTQEWTSIPTTDNFSMIEPPAPAVMKAEVTSASKDQSLISRLTGVSRSNTNSPSIKPVDPRTWPQEAIHEIQKRDEALLHMKAYLARLEERILSQEQEISALTTSLADTEHKLDTTRQDLNASRAFVSSEGTADAQYLIKTLRELNSSIDDFAFRFMQEIVPDTAISKTVTKAGLEALGRSYHGAGKITSFLNCAYSRQVNVGDFIHPFVCYAVCQRLFDLVFTPFVPGLDKERSDIFHQIYQLVHENEPQERSARWRAITYSHAHRASNRIDRKSFCERAADDLISKLVDAINPLINPESITFDAVKAELGDIVKQLFEDAVKLQDKAKTGYMSFDYTAFMTSPDSPFHPMYMETAQDVRQGGKGKASNAVLTISLGLQAWKSVVREDKTVGKDASVAVKANVICGNWNPNA